MINDNELKEEIERSNYYVKICERAETSGLYKGSRLELFMDIESADNTFNLRLDDFLNANDMDFSHDIIGIINNIKRN